MGVAIYIRLWNLLYPVHVSSSRGPGDLKHRDVEKPCGVVLSHGPLPLRVSLPRLGSSEIDERGIRASYEGNEQIWERLS